MSTYIKDLAERVVATGAFAFLSVFSFSDLSTLHGAEVAAGAAVASLIKGLLAKYIGDDSAGLK